MNLSREQLADEKRRLVRVQKSLLKASKEQSLPELLDAVAQLTLTVNALLKNLEEK